MKNVMREIFDWLKTIVAIFLVITFIHSYIFTPVLVDGQSMYPTLHDGDSVILWELFYEPSLFDIVVFQVTEDTYFVKRVVGVPGQEVAYRNDQLYIDGEPVDQPYLAGAKGQVAALDNRWSPDMGTFTEDFELEDICRFNGFEGCQVIPEGYYLMLGDNRPGSKDSRHIGLINQDQIMGRAIWVQWPMSRFGLIRD
ncbi:MAG: signal peptidase I [Turicibacter sp.]|nr:signal peptidase I [Turicibacter sp.]